MIGVSRGAFGAPMPFGCVLHPALVAPVWHVSWAGLISPDNGQSLRREARAWFSFFISFVLQALHVVQCFKAMWFACGCSWQLEECRQTVNSTFTSAAQHSGWHCPLGQFHNSFLFLHGDCSTKQGGRFRLRWGWRPLLLPFACNWATR